MDDNLNHYLPTIYVKAQLSINIYINLEKKTLGTFMYTFYNVGEVPKSIIHLL